MYVSVMNLHFFKHEEYVVLTPSDIRSIDILGIFKYQNIFSFLQEIDIYFCWKQSGLG